MKIGFIGTGALTSAIVTGLKSIADNHLPIVLSPRNEQISAGLAARFPDVRVATDNQTVLDECDTVMLAVRPQIAHEVLQKLRFRPEHLVVSLIATLSREEIASLVAPAAQVAKALPMPMIAHRQGATIVWPPVPAVTALFDRLGKVIEVESSSELDALSVVTATFAAYFKYLDTIQTWLNDRAVPDDKARDYIATLFKALAHAPEMKPDARFIHLSEEYATRGGINEQVLRELMDHGVFDVLTDSLDAVNRRISRAGREN